MYVFLHFSNLFIQIIILLYVILPLLFSSFIAHISIPEQYGLVLPVFELHINKNTQFLKAIGGTELHLP